MVADADGESAKILKRTPGNPIVRKAPGNHNARAPAALEAQLAQRDIRRPGNLHHRFVASVETTTHPAFADLLRRPEIKNPRSPVEIPLARLIQFFKDV